MGIFPSSGSRNSFISLGKVVCFLFSDQDDLCDLSCFPLSLVCQEDYSCSFSLICNHLTYCYILSIFLLLFTIKNICLFVCLPFIQCLISFQERGEAEMYVFICVYMYMQTYICIHISSYRNTSI